MCDQKLKVVTALIKRLSVVMLAFREGRSGYSRCWVLPVMRVNSLQSALSQILAKVGEK